MLKKLLNLFTSEFNVSKLNKEELSYEEEFPELIIDEKFLIDEYWIINVFTRGLISVLFLFYKRGEGDVTNDGGSTDGYNPERDTWNENGY